MPELRQKGDTMAITAFPFDGQDTTESQYSALFRELQDTGVVGSFGEASLRVTADSTGMQVKVSAGAAIVRGHYVSSTAVETKPIAAATSLPRIDVVVARLDPGTDSITIVVIKGTAATTPAPPALTQTDTGVYEVPLANVTIPASAATIAASDVADARLYIGHRVGVWTTANRPGTPRRGRLGLNATTGVWEFWTGTAWADLAPVVNWGSIAGKPPTFAPSAHTHSATEIFLDGQSVSVQSFLVTVQNGLAGKAATFHTHSADQVFLVGQSTTVQTFLGTLQNGVNEAKAAASGKANALNGDPTAVSYAGGPTLAGYSRESGANRYATWMDGTLQFGRAVSSRRYKDDIAAWDVDVDAVLSIEPQTFHRKVDVPGVMDFGAIAEDLHDAGLTELVYYDDDGQVDGIKDHHIPWALLAVIRTLHERLAAVERQLEERDA